MVVATDVAGNMAGSPIHLVLSAPLPAPNSLQITPAGANFLVGDTQQFTAVDELGRPRPDVTWSVSDSTIATISTDSSPAQTGVAPGQVTLTATIGGVSTQTQVTVFGGNSLPIGTAVWSAPPMPGFTAQTVVQAVPTPNNTPSLYAIYLNDTTGDTLVRGFTGTGRSLWQRNLPTSLGVTGPFMGNATGGLLLGAAYMSIIDIDGQSGAIAFSSTNPSSWDILGAVAPDGSIYTIGTSTGWNVDVLQRVDPNTGQSKPFYVGKGGSEPVYGFAGCSSGVPWLQVWGSQTIPANLSSPIVDSQGNVLLTSSLFTSSSTPICVDNGADATVVSFTDYQYSFVKVAPNGSATTSSLPISTAVGPNSPRVLAPDGEGGALVTWSVLQSDMSYKNYMMSTTAGIAYPTPLNAQNPSVVLGENGNAFITDGTTVEAFDQFSGSSQWTYTRAQGVASLQAAEGGGVTIIDSQSNQVPLDAGGNVGTITSCSEIYASLASWNWLSLGLNQFSIINCPPSEIGASQWPLENGNSAASNSSPSLYLTTFMARIPGTPYTLPWGIEGTARASIENNVLSFHGNSRFYSTIETDTSGLSTTANFLTANKFERSDVLGFIGDSDVITCAPGLNNPNCPQFSDGLLFTDTWLLRTPNCDNLTLNLCYYVSLLGPSHSEPCFAGEYPSGGLCYTFTPPCPDGAVQLGSHCFVIPYNALTRVTAVTRNVMNTTAKVVFVAACDTTDVFIGWWNLNLNDASGGRALVVPDLAAMANLPTNNDPQNPIPPQNLGSVDLSQGAVAYNALIASLAQPHHTAKQALIDANNAVSAYYSTLSYTTSSVGPLPQVVYRLVGNEQVCPTGTCNPGN